MVDEKISYIPDFAWSNLPFTMEMLWTLAIGIHSAELAQLLNCSIGILIVFWIIISQLLSERTLTPVAAMTSALQKACHRK